MAVIRVNKTSNYTIMSNVHFKDKRMTLKAKGLLSLMLSLPDNWDYSIAGLCAICVEKESAVKSTLNELRDCGYLKINKLFPNKTKSGRIEYVYDIYETPQNQGLEKQGIENQGVENQGQLNTNESNTNISNNNNNKDIGEKRKRFIPPTLDEVKAYCIERKNNVDAERFIDYYTSNGWQVGKNKMKDWKAAVRTWERNGFSSQKKVGVNGIVIDQSKDDLDDLF